MKRTNPFSEPVVSSLLENDLYKFTMWQALLHSHPSTDASYEFICRNQPLYPLAELKEELEAQIDHLCGLSFTEEELAYLRGLRFIKRDFVDFLSIFRLQRKFISIATEGDNLVVRVDGPMVHTTPFEIYVLQIVNELYYRRFDQAKCMTEGITRLQEKVDSLCARRESLLRSHRHPFEFVDFGLRRRFSGLFQERVIETLIDQVPDFFKGTSNVYLAKKYNIVPIGTHAHEWFGIFQCLPSVRLRNFQRAALQAWVDEYRGDLGTALTDMVGMDAFLEDFDLYFAKLFDSLRHDSGNPIVWGEKAIAHYKNLRIDPHTKGLVFSDSLDFAKAFDIYEHFSDRIKTSFGIGTNLTNDTGVPALNIVMKLMACNGQPVAKISDANGKTHCKDAGFLAYLRQVFEKNE